MSAGANQTPAMRQYLQMKKENQDSILFFRMGDFYEMFFDDAKAASRILGIALTSRDKGREIPMCGVPYHAASSYIARLVREGHKVAVCEQMQDPALAKGVVERSVVRVITPGIAFDDELLEPKTNNFIASAVFRQGGATCGFSYMDASTGEFRATELAGPSELYDEIRRIRPLELLVQETRARDFAAPELSIKKLTAVPDYDFGFDVSLERLNAHFTTASLDGFGLRDFTAGIMSAGSLLHYIKETQRSRLRHVKKCIPYFTGDYLVMDPATRRNLELTQNSKDGTAQGTLFEILDRTRTAMGGRALRSWLLYPLKNVDEITGRLDAVEELVAKRAQRVAIEALLEGVYDLERLSSRVSLGIAGPKDVVALKLSLEKIPAIYRELAVFSSGLVSTLRSSMEDTLADVARAARDISDAIVDSPPYSVKDGGVIRPGYSPELDSLRDIGAGGKDWIARLETQERSRTGINSLKVGYNRVFGYYIEITKANLANVPEDYARKQTLVNAERFITPALKEWEDKILSSQEKSCALESGIFCALIERLSALSDPVQKASCAVSTLDALVSLASVAHERRYAKPRVNEGEELSITDGRHPVIEARSTEGFIPNDLVLNPVDCRIMILTGPNMAGKSTYLRQNALIAVMAQIGSFVPARKAVIGVCDRIFTRVGASDDLARGQSTFMVEMNETANILNNATEKSFIILDEIGRGTSTFDGLSIAWAVAEYLHDTAGVRAKTLFATHYHELTELSLTKERVKNYNMAVSESGGKVVFLRKVVPGGTNRSYGIHVARLAGLPEAVIDRAIDILKNLESGELTDSGMPRIASSRGGATGAVTAHAPIRIDPALQRVADELEKTDTDKITPIEAINALYRLKELLGGRG